MSKPCRVGPRQLWMNALETMVSGKCTGSSCLEDNRLILLLPPYHTDSQPCLFIITILMEDQICPILLPSYSGREVGDTLWSLSTLVQTRSKQASAFLSSWFSAQHWPCRLLYPSDTLVPLTVATCDKAAYLGEGDKEREGGGRGKQWLDPATLRKAHRV